MTVKTPYFWQRLHQIGVSWSPTPARAVKSSSVSTTTKWEENASRSSTVDARETLTNSLQRKSVKSLVEAQ